MSVTPHRSHGNATSTASSGDGGIMASLYRQSIGPLNADYYQRQFDQLEVRGPWHPTWNHGAAFCTLAWLMLRRMYRPAMMYGGILLLLLALAMSPARAAVPTAWQLPIAGGIAALLALIPGLWGNALYYRQVREQTLHALSSSSNLVQAQRNLGENGIDQERLHMAAAGQLALVVAMGGMLISQWDTTPAPEPVVASAPAELVIPGSVAEAQAQASATTQQAEPDAAAPAENPEAAPATELVAPETSAPSATEVSTSAPLDSTATTNTAAAATETAPETPKTDAPPTPAAAPTVAAEAASDTATTTAEVVPTAAATTTPAATSAAASAAAATPRAKPATPSKSAAPATAAKSASNASAPALPPTSSRSHRMLPGKFYLNAGVYSQPANATRAIRKLEAAKLQVVRQTLSTSQGEMTRLRVGPYDSRQRAEQVMAQIKGMGLDASVHRQPRETP